MLAGPPACNRYAADGYSRSTGTLGAIAVTYGVGSLSVINAVAGAYAEDIPLVVIVGNPPTGVVRGLSAGEGAHRSCLGSNGRGKQNKMIRV